MHFWSWMKSMVIQTGIKIYSLDVTIIMESLKKGSES